MSIRAFKYASPFLTFAFAYISFTSTGWLTFLPVIWSYTIIPIFELKVKPDETNLEAKEEEMAKKISAFVTSFHTANSRIFNRTA